jgi:DNA-directed RNA polymerase subunit N|tara:strand:- start:468 stop:674 length:207 start_codon:yes stop_codon:yes gene_type:complete
MLFPVKCFTCGSIIGNKYEEYKKKVKDSKQEYLNTEKAEKTDQGLTLDSLNVNDMCCRRHFLTHVDIF